MAKYSRKYSREQTDGVDAALAISLGVYCAFATCFALGLYALLQPSRHPNSGLAGYKPPPAMVVTYLPSFRNAVVSKSAALAAAETAKSETIKAETSGQVQAQAQADAQKPAQEVRAEAPKRQRAATARRETRDSGMRYAEQPFSSGSTAGVWPAVCPLPLREPAKVAALNASLSARRACGLRSSKPSSSGCSARPAAYAPSRFVRHSGAGRI